MRRPTPDNTIEALSSNVFDNGRRGEPMLGCDCMRCFGYCIVDQDMKGRELSVRALDPVDDRLGRGG